MPKKLVFLLLWIITTASALTASFIAYHGITASYNLAPLLAQQVTPSFALTPPLVYAALPTTSNQIIAMANPADARPVMIDKYLRSYHSPLTGYGQFITQVSDQHGLDPYLFVAIAQQESNLCKKIPADSFNCWGWGIHSQGTLRFDNFDQAITTVITGLTDNYIGRGLIEPEDIMRKYTPLSNGSWADGVNQFLEELASGDF